MDYNLYLTEKAKKTIKQLDECLYEVYQNPNKYINWVKQGLKFKKYSANNQSLIYYRFPNAKYVANYKKWQELGFQVNKNEKSISLLRPNNIKGFYDKDGKFITLKKATLEQQKEIKIGNIKTTYKMCGFGVFSVFDISQTNATESDLSKLMQEQINIVTDETKLLSKLANIFEYDVSDDLNYNFIHLKEKTYEYINQNIKYTTYEKALICNAMVYSLFSTVNKYTKEIEMLVINDIATLDSLVNMSNIELGKMIKDRIKVFLDEVIPYLD